MSSWYKGSNQTSQDQHPPKSNVQFRPQYEERFGRHSSPHISSSTTREAYSQYPQRQSLSQQRYHTTDRYTPRSSVSYNIPPPEDVGRISPSPASAQGSVSQSQKIWSKFKSFNFSISSTEQDGDTEDETVVAGALAKFYAEKDGEFPPWLASTKVAQNYRRQSQPAPRTRTESTGGYLQDIYKRVSVSETRHKSMDPNSLSGNWQNNPSAPTPPASYSKHQWSRSISHPVQRVGQVEPMTEGINNMKLDEPESKPRPGLYSPARSGWKSKATW